MRTRLTAFITTLCGDSRARIAVVTLYYVAVVLGLIVLYGRGDFSTPAFVYQGF